MIITNTEQTLKIQFLPVGNADAIHLRFLDKEHNWRNILVDGGFRQTYRKVIRPLLETILHAGECIDLWVLTHWDNDHIEGAVEFFCTDTFPEKGFVREFWFNANYRIYKEPASGFTGIKEGVLLRNYLENVLGIPSPVITVETPVKTFSGLKITTLGPELEIYIKAMSEMQVFAPVGRKERDYEKRLDDLKFNRFYPDRDLVNRSSLVLLLEYDGFRVLLLADASPLDLLPRLQRLGFSPENRLHVDLVKVAHHGSKKNTSDALLNLLSCQNFVFTADGSDLYKFPDKETIARILQHVPDRTYPIHLYFNHQNEILENIFAVDGKDVMERYNFKVHFPPVEQNENIICVTVT